MQKLGTESRRPFTAFHHRGGGWKVIWVRGDRRVAPARALTKLSRWNSSGVGRFAGVCVGKTTRTRLIDDRPRHSRSDLGYVREAIFSLLWNTVSQRGGLLCIRSLSMLVSVATSSRRKPEKLESPAAR